MLINQRFVGSASRYPVVTGRPGTPCGPGSTKNARNRSRRRKLMIVVADRRRRRRRRTSGGRKLIFKLSPQLRQQI